VSGNAQERLRLSLILMARSRGATWRQIAALLGEDSPAAAKRHVHRLQRRHPTCQEDNDRDASSETGLEQSGPADGV
jgi:hypothetical protein